MVINIGPLPEASEKEGRGGRALTELVADLFGGGRDRVFRIGDPADATALIGRNTQRDFTLLRPATDAGAHPAKQKTGDPTPYVMHRRIGGRDLFAVYNVGGAQRAVSVHGEPRSCGIRGRAGNARCGLPPSRMPEPRW